MRNIIFNRLKYIAVGVIILMAVFVSSKTASAGTVSGDFSISYSADCAGGTAWNGSSCVPPPTVSVSASPSSIGYASSSTISWSSTNATSCSSAGGSGTSGSFGTGALTASQTYTVTCYGVAGSGSGSATVYVSARPAPTVSVSASPSSVGYTGSSTISWSSSNADSCSSAGGSATSGSFGTGSLTASQTYTVTCYGNGTASGSATVYVSARPAPTVSVSASPSSIGYTSSSTISWSSTDSDSCSSAGGSGTSGSFGTGSLTASQTYTVTCYGNGTASGSATVYVASAPSGTLTQSASSCAISSGSSSCSIGFSWSTSNPIGTSAVTSYAGTEGTGNSSSGTFSVPYGSKTFYLYNSGYLLDQKSVSSSCVSGANWNGSICIYPAPVPSLTVSGWGLSGQGPGVTYAGSTFTLSWGTVANASSCSLDYYGGVSTSAGSVNMTANYAGYNRSYTLTCTGPGGSGSSTVSNISYPPPPTGVSLSCSANGQTASASWNAPSGWNTFYTRATPPSYALYSDSATGTSASFSTTPGTSYSFWVHTRAPNGAWSDAVYGYTACSNPAPTATLNITDNWAYGSYVHQNISTYAWNDSGVALSWSSTDATACTVYDDGSPRWSGTSNGGTSVGGISARSHTYSISCTNPYSGTTATDTRVLTVPTSPTSVTFSPTSCSGNTLNLTWSQNSSYGKGAPYIYDNGSLIYNGDASNVSGGAGSASISTTPGHNYTAIVYARDGTQPSWPYSSGVNPTAVTCPYPTGSLSASPASCTITAGASTCNTTLTWSTTYPSGTSAITRTGGVTVVTGNSGSGSYSFPYGGTTFYLYNAGYLLDQKSVTSSCAVGSTWTGSICAAPSGTLTSSANSCIIPSGGSTCTIPFTWSTTNPIGTSAVTQDGAGTVATGNSGSSISFTIPYSSALFRLYNNANELANKSVTSSCISGTSWVASSGICMGPPVVTVVASPQVVEYGGTTTISWSSINSTSCSSPSGGGSGTSGSFTTPPLTGNTVYTVTCTGPGGTASGSVGSNGTTISVKPNVVFTSVPKLLISRRPATLTWTSNYATSCVGTNFSTGTGSPTAGSKVVSSISTVSYIVTCTGPGGTTAKTLKVPTTKIKVKES